MSNDRTARERLDALLTELEEETLAKEDIVSTDVAATRSLIESAIEKHMRAETTRSVAPGRLTAAKGKVASSMERLGRLTGIGQGGITAVGATTPDSFLRDERQVATGASARRAPESRREGTERRGGLDGWDGSDRPEA